MNQKLITVLFVSVFYYGVTYSSPLDVQNEGMGLAEEKPPTEPRPTTELVGKKIETGNANTHIADNVPSNQQVNTTKVVNPSSQKVKEVTDPALKISTLEPPQRVTEEASKETINNKNKTISSGKVYSESPAGTSTPTSTVAPAALPTASTTVVKSATVAPPPLTNVTEHKSSNTADKTSTTIRTPENSSKTTTTSTTTTTAVPTTIKVDITSSSSASINKDSVIEHNTPAPVQEKHFDGQSFVGGMALTIGLTAIGFIAFKYYKSGKIDMNYRTL